MTSPALFTLGQRVQWRGAVGTVVHVLAHGWGYQIEFPGGQTITCMKEVLQPAPQNVVPFVRQVVGTHPNFQEWEG